MKRIMLVTYDEEDRIRNIIQELIDNNEVKAYRSFTNVSNSTSLSLQSTHILLTAQFEKKSQYAFPPDT